MNTLQVMQTENRSTNNFS